MIDSLRQQDFAIDPDDRILITGATGFIGTRVVQALLDRGFRNLRCFGRPFGNISGLSALLKQRKEANHVETLQGNLLSAEDCAAAVRDVSAIIHLAAGRGEKSFPDAYMNSVVTTRNLLEAARHSDLKRFVNISSFAVYSNRQKPAGRTLDESCPMESRPAVRGEAYCFAKVKQDELVFDYGRRYGIPYVIVRPGYVYGPGKTAITGRVGIDSFGPFLHMGGTNRIPFTYVENCAEAIALAALVPGVEGEIFNVVDDDLPSSRNFLRLYKRNVKNFSSFYIPHALSYLLCYLWQWYSSWSKEQLPPSFNTSRWHANWKKTEYTNAKAKSLLGWSPRVPTTEGLKRFFEGCCGVETHA